jgi:hypothetical protein
VNVKKAPDDVGRGIGETLRHVLIHPLVFFLRDSDEGGNGVGSWVRGGRQGAEGRFEGEGRVFGV